MQVKNFADVQQVLRGFEALLYLDKFRGGIATATLVGILATRLNNDPCFCWFSFAVKRRDHHPCCGQQKNGYHQYRYKFFHLN